MLEIIVVHDSDYGSWLHFFKDGKPVEPEEINVEIVNFDPGKTGADDPEWREAMTTEAAALTQAAGDTIRELLEQYR